MADFEDDGTPASQQVTTGRDAYTAGRDLHLHGASPAQADGNERPGTSVDGSSSIQVGSGNFQVNNFYDGNTTGNRRTSFSAQLSQRAVPLHDGLRAGTMLALEVRAHHELDHVNAVMTAVAGPAGAATIPPPVRLYWHPSREVSITIAQGASGLVNVCRTGPMPPGAVMETPDQDLPWTLPDGRWEVRLQLTARRNPALYITASFSVTPAKGFPIQHVEWLTLTVA